MEITQETDYAVRCILYLSRYAGETPIMIETISEEMRIPRSFLAKILQRLAKAGIVQSFRGVKGGFQLKRPPSAISLLDVVEAIEGPVAMNRCTIDPQRCDLSGACTVHPVWQTLQALVVDYLGKTTFDTMMQCRK
ncbi:MAG: Rrf2 family transcriptional regulator [Thermodesulfovibrio sp.]|nr:Rrf2 family transcriptional regulator [Thermodesulfovibrio sp.]